MRRALWLVVLFLASPAFAVVNYYVRTDGNDAACTGKGDASCASVSCSGTSNNFACATRTIGKAEQLAGENDAVVNVRAGNFYEPVTITMAEAGASADVRHKISGAGTGSTFVFMGLSEALSCSAAGTYTYSCTGVTGSIYASSTRTGRTGVCMVLGGSTRGVDDANDVNIHPWSGSDTPHTVNEFICLTPASATTGAIDYNDDGVGEADLDSTSARGMWYADADGPYIINPWTTSTQPGDTGITVHSPTSTTAIVAMNAPFQTIEDLTIYAGTGTGVGIPNTGDNFVVEDVRILGGGIGTTNAVGTCALTGGTMRRVEVLYTTRRILNKACGEVGNPCLGNTSDYVTISGAGIWGCDMTTEDLVVIGGREGASFIGENHTVRRMHVSSCFNHGWAAADVLQTASFENVLTYNNLEGGFFAECPQNIRIKNSTLTGGTIIFNGTALTSSSFDEHCTSGIDGMSGAVITNSLITGVFHNALSTYCGTGFIHAREANGGAANNDYDWNLYYLAGQVVKDWRCTGTDYTYSTLAQWQAHTGGGACSPDGCADLCSNCTRDTNSETCLPTSGTCGGGAACTVDDLFVNPDDDDIDDASPSDYHLLSTSCAVNNGSTTVAYATTDFDQNPRVGAPDIGAFEYIPAVACGNGTIVPPEVCDCGGDACTSGELASQTCASIGRGFTGGTLTCCDGLSDSADCGVSNCTAFDAGSCTGDSIAPGDITTMDASSPTNTTCALSWTMTCDNGTTPESGNPTTHVIKRSTSPITDITAFNAATDLNATEPGPVCGQSQSITETGLALSTTYYFRSRVGDGTNTSGLSNEDSCTTTGDSTAPSPITDLSAGTPTTTSCPITWHDTGNNGSSGNFGTGSDTLVKWRVDDGSGGSGLDTPAEWNLATNVTASGPCEWAATPCVAGSLRAATLSGLPAGATIDIAIVLRDESGNPSDAQITAGTAVLDYATCTTTELQAPITNPETVTGATIEGGGTVPPP